MRPRGVEGLVGSGDLGNGGGGGESMVRFEKVAAWSYDAGHWRRGWRN